MAGRVLPAFPVLSGIKQGCPSSGTIFAIALDPFIRMLCMRIPRHLGVFCAFADDIGAVLLSLKDTFHLIVEAFILLRKASALTVNTKKTQLMPLYEQDQVETRLWLKHQREDWSHVLIEQSILHLGVAIGPEAHSRFWTTTINKIKLAAIRLKSLALPWTSAMRWFNIAIESIPQYLLQFQHPSKELTTQEAISLSLVAGVPPPSGGCRPWDSSFESTPLRLLVWLQRYASS